jgi:hypothetical protein
LRRNCPHFRSNTTGATNGEGTAHNSDVTRLVLLVEEELPTLQKNTTAATSGEGIDFSWWAVPPLLAARIVLLLKSGQFLLY